MSKLEETNSAIDYINKLAELGIKVDNIVILADIAKSLAMIADKLCMEESEGVRNGARRTDKANNGIVE